LRWHPLNAVSLCTGHHAYFTGNPLEFAKWIEGELGKANTNKLRIMAGRTFRVSKPLLDDIHQNLKASLEQMEMERAEGKHGRIEFESPYP